MRIIKKVLVHSCLKKEQGWDEDSVLPDGCRCRRWITVLEAKGFVDTGEAAFVTVLRRGGESEADCHICGKLPEYQKHCTACEGTGIIKTKKDVSIRGENIVFVSNLKKTPRTATIEKAHIERKLMSKAKEFREESRIDAYERLTVEFLGELGAEVRESKTGEITKPGIPEPADDPKLHTGRRYDYGRAL